MGKHSAPRRRGALAVTTGAAAVAATAVFATTLADGGHPVPSAAAVPHEAGTEATPTSTPVPTSTRGEAPDRASRSVRRTAPPAGETPPPAPPPPPRRGAPPPSPAPRASPPPPPRTPPRTSPPGTPTATPTPSVTPSGTPSSPGVVTRVVDGVAVIVGGLLP
ncbi:hypothetical protein [Phycicoccus sp.]|uniref:hypothetical protein n=1 Tax=Phycicoccus sp. TaxID=1902410 RepID=UPI002C3F5A2F|nr:hypothetical protein [Phycicoccus sp.]HMM94134.1 hypothetical protein [Phycicoccus sp.]